MDQQFSLLRRQLSFQKLPPQQLLEAILAWSTVTREQQEHKAYLLGWVYTLLQQWSPALDALDALLPTPLAHALDSGKFSDKVRHALCHLCLGRAAVALRYWDDASRHLASSLSLLRGTRAGLLTFEAHQLAGYVFLQREMGKEALYEYTRAVPYGRAACSSEWRADLAEGRAAAYHLLGMSKQMKREVEKALTSYLASGNRVEQARMYLFLADWSRDEAPQLTMSYVEHGLKTAQESGSFDLYAQIQMLASEHLHSCGELQQALTASSEACCAARRCGDAELLADARAIQMGLQEQVQQPFNKECA